MKPAEGTILTVARLSAAKAADAARENNFIEFVHEAAIEEAVKALADTVNQNPVLKKAGVVDAGGKGSWRWKPCSAPCRARTWCCPRTAR